MILDKDRAITPLRWLSSRRLEVFNHDDAARDYRQIKENPLIENEFISIDRGEHSKRTYPASRSKSCGSPKRSAMDPSEEAIHLTEKSQPWCKRTDAQHKRLSTGPFPVSETEFGNRLMQNNRPNRSNAPRV